MRNSSDPTDGFGYTRLRYVRFLLRRGARRGELLAVLIPSGLYALAMAYPLIEALVRSQFFGLEINSRNVASMTILARIGIVGALLNACVMWLVIRSEHLPPKMWIAALTIPLVLVLTFSLVFFGGEFSISRTLVVAIMMSAGYVVPNTLSSVWPYYRQYADQPTSST